ncbi:LANO_0H01816g1_1 [Lachancea nothofagi CBS 11611]|uniref:LANO_0H01816g1_1 n=1 Tax=Lachancea nothofagi CBS 11611 TaxID=1266666 RepID=A0A1G4KKT8_9SACH|nr:LANO_0H01816g1_1 [Lachancea nothofagi CBS 11611]
MDQTSGADALKKAAPKLPLSKVKRIAKTDPDYTITSQSAIAAVAFATELFVQVLTEEGLARSQLEKSSGSRLTLRYENLAAVVASSERFAFLSDVLPETHNLVALTRENRVRYTALAPGQSMLPFRAREEPTQVENEEESVEEELEPDADADAELDVDMNGEVDFDDDLAELGSRDEAEIRAEEEPEPEPELEPEHEPEPEANQDIQAMDSDLDE